MSFKVREIEAMRQNEGGYEKAMDILKRVAKQVEPIMEKRKWRVGKLMEFLPKNDSLWGLNVNRGEKILVRLRNSSSPSSFMEVERVLDTMLHELVHNEIGPHSDKFYEMLDQLRSECEATMTGGFNAFKDAHVPFEGDGQQLGGHKPLRFNRADLRDAMAKAAEKRLKRDHIMTAGGQRLGGSKCSKEEIKDRMLRAAEQRKLDSERCRTAQELAGGGKSGASSMGAGQWACGMCTYLNGATTLRCEVCYTAKGTVDACGAGSSSSTTVGNKQAQRGTGDQPSSASRVGPRSENEPLVPRGTTAAPPHIPPAPSTQKRTRPEQPLPEGEGEPAMLLPCPACTLLNDWSTGRKCRLCEAPLDSNVSDDVIAAAPAPASGTVIRGTIIDLTDSP